MIKDTNILDAIQQTTPFKQNIPKRPKNQNWGFLLDGKTGAFFKETKWLKVLD